MVKGKPKVAFTADWMPTLAAETGLVDRFVVPPFSVLDTRQGYWRDRRRAWVGLGIQGEAGRAGDPGGGAFVDSEEYGDIMNRAATYDERGLKKTVVKSALNPGAGERVAPLTAKSRWKGSPNSWASFGTRLKDGAVAITGATARIANMHGANIPKPAMGDANDWQKRQTEWVGNDNTTMTTVGTGVSVFDPVLCELAYRWFCPPQGCILDPFAGGVVRGFVAGKLGYQYTGIEVREEQVVSNEEQVAVQQWPSKEARPKWILGDSLHMHKYLPATPDFDLLFTCPPYYDLEVYSATDSSALPTYAEFMDFYWKVFWQAVQRLKDNRFAVIVVGEIRDRKTGFYRNFVGDTVDTFMQLGLRYYNEIILVTSIGSLPIRIGGQFSGGRKIGKTHQNVLVFYKGDSDKDIEKGLGRLDANNYE